jgi:poly-gamma-glutamate system protein
MEMTKFRAKSNIVLGTLFVLALLALLAVENSKVDVRQEWYAEKLEAARLAKTAEECLKNYRLQNGVFIDAVNDPNQTALIGQEYTLVTTDRGYVDAKLSTTNPNFAAIIVQLLKEAGCEEHDNVAIAFTGSFPALNIAVLAAIETLKLHPVIITSVGASNFGANDPYFTWLDMENVLNSSNVFHYRSVAASIGGGNDIGRGLSPEGRQLLMDAISRNSVLLINEEYLEKSIERRMEIYRENSQEKPYQAFINVGGGIASLGNTINANFIPPGLTMDLSIRNFPVHGVIIRMAQEGVPLIHLMNVKQLLNKYGLPYNPEPMPEPGEGGIFIQTKYNVLVTGIAVFILAAVVVLVYLGERKHHRLGTDVVPNVQEQKHLNREPDDLAEL